MAEPARWLDRDAAAAYLSLTVTAFNRRVGAGRLPAGVARLGSRCLRWDRQVLDAAMGGDLPSPPDPQEAFDAVAARIRAGAAGGPKAPRGRHGAGVPVRPQAGYAGRRAAR